MRLAGALAAAMLLLAATTVEATPPFARDRIGWAEACQTYENRARYLPREPPVAFVAVLAEACAGAPVSLDSGRPTERDAAARLLARIAAFRDTILRMNIERVYGARPPPRAMPKRRAGRMREIARVTSTGEYLIAHHMGVVEALERWLDTGAAFPLASR